ncbi:MAG: twin-arginine translocase subunit TatC [Planctomycetota bacterium]
MEDIGLYENLKALRRVVIRISIVFCLILVGTFFFEEKIINILMKPLKSSHIKYFEGLVILSPTESILTYLKVNLWLTLLLGIPYLIVEIWFFIYPALYPTEKKILGFILFSSLFFSYSAILCAYFFVLPYFLKFLIEFLPEGVKVQYSLEKYIVFFFSITVGLIITFQTPLITFGLIKLGIVSKSALLKKWKLVIILALIVSAILTPTTDPLSQILFALPIIILYFFGIICAFFI